MAIENMMGKKYGKLTIKKQYYEIVSSGEKRDFCDCLCDCGNKKNHVLGKNIRRGSTSSCGCISREANWNACHKINEYELINENTMSGIDGKGKVFYFSPEDYNEIKDYCWSVGEHGYAVSKERGKKETVFLHNLIMKAKEKRTVDHINRKRNDNRRTNLRFITIQLNNINKSRSLSINTSGVIGVSMVSEDRWHSYIVVDGKRRSSYSKTFEEAVYSRLKMEKEFYGEYSPQKDLFEEFGL